MTDGTALSGHRQQSVAVLAGGCFWCTEAEFAQLRGVDTVVPGYTGGTAASPSYELVCTGTTGHAEAVRITFDPETLPYPELLRVFFAVHDPTTPNRQGNDIGTQYRSAIFYGNAAQKSDADRVMAELRESGGFAAPIVTELTPLGEFYPAEAYHHDYYTANPSQPYCSTIIGPKLAKFRHLFRERLKP